MLSFRYNEREDIMKDKLELTDIEKGVQKDIGYIKEPKNMKEVVINKIAEMRENYTIQIPKGYNPTNALHSAWFIFEQDKKLQNASNSSIANSLLKMVALGLDPAKNQGYFIPYGNNVQFQPSYHGNAYVLKRDTGALTVFAQVVYEDDDFDFDVDLNTGSYRILKHKSSLKNMDSKKPVGAYATIQFDDERKNYTEIMTYDQILNAWSQSKSIQYAMRSGKDYYKDKTNVHYKFQEEMVKKTVLNRASKRFINSSDTLTNMNLINQYEHYDEHVNNDITDDNIDNLVDEKQATQTLDFDTVEDMAQSTNEQVQFDLDDNKEVIEEAEYKEAPKEIKESESWDVPF